MKASLGLSLLDKLLHSLVSRLRLVGLLLELLPGAALTLGKLNRRRRETRVHVSIILLFSVVGIYFSYPVKTLRFGNVP